MPETRKKILVVAGEASGDILGANMIHAALGIDPELLFYGVGGPRMQSAGCTLLRPASDLAVMGLAEVLRHLPRIWSVYRDIKRALNSSDERPDVVVLIDSPDFNLRIAKLARKSGVPVLYYVSPQVWAWRRGRVKTIARDVDKLAAILPFEPEYYAGLDIDVRYVGHPLLDEAEADTSAVEFRTQHDLDKSEPVIGLLPGSRRNEIHYALPAVLEAAQLLKQRYPGVGFLLPVASGLNQALLQESINASGLDVELVDDTIYTSVAACDAVIAVSGTVTLQIALVQTPMVIIYKGSPFTYAIGKHLVSISHFGLPNIVAGRRVIRELLQHEANPEAIAAEIEHIIDSPDYRNSMLADLAEIRSRMGTPGCAERVARMVMELSEKGSFEKR
ncbi:MAG: lipid-A-disaccharide synthase [Desulfuromonadaceae bacterium]|nr:lipid-A-disaccharide synthase [Geobacteraceae bacterium]